MSEILRNILWMSVSGSAVILAVLAVRAIGHRAPKLFAYALWIVVLFRLLCPVAVESEFSALGVGERAAHGLTERFGYQSEEKEDAPVKPEPGAAVGKLPAVSDGVVDAGIVSPNLRQEEILPEKVGSRLVGERADTVLFFVWIAGMLCLLGYSLAAELRLKRFLRTAVREEGNIYIKGGIQTPFVLGVFAPKIYLPKGLSDKEREYLLLHERTHIRRGDPLTRRLAFLALMLHWFNPLVWAAFFLSGRDMEMSCDERVLKMLGNGIKRDYSNSLLSMADEKHLVAGIPMAFAEGDTKRRIRNVLRYHKTKAGIAVLCVCVFAIVILALATDPKPVGGKSGGGDEPTMLDGDDRDQADTGETESQAGSESGTGSSDDSAVSQTDARKIYAKALRNVLQKHELPAEMDELLSTVLDGREAVMQFAVCDVDTDGRSELVLLIDPGITAGMRGYIFDVDPASGRLRTQLEGFPDFHFLQNGNIKEMSSHNQTYGEMWPYELYQYLPESDTYRAVGYVETMDRSTMERRGHSEEYPLETDVSGAGTVYYIEKSGELWKHQPCDESVYRAWLTENEADGEELEVTYLPLSEENIQAMERGEY